MVNVEKSDHLSSLAEKFQDLVEEKRLNGKDVSLSIETQLEAVSLLIQQSTLGVELFSALIAVAAGKKPTEEFDDILRSLEQGRGTLSSLLDRVLSDLERENG